jgi:hypothetical protein
MHTGIARRLRRRDERKPQEADEHDDSTRSHASLIHLFLGIGDRR